MALPDRFFLWKDGNSHFGSEEPDYEIDSKPILDPYFRQLGISSEDLSAQSFELLIASWLSELMYSGMSLDELDGRQAWLVESGLYDELIGGRLAYEAMV